MYMRELFGLGFFWGGGKSEGGENLFQNGLGNLYSHEQSFALKDSLFRLSFKVSNFVSTYCMMSYR